MKSFSRQVISNTHIICLKSQYYSLRQRVYNMTKTTQSVFDVRMFEYEKELKDLYYELYADNSYYSADESITTSSN